MNDDQADEREALLSIYEEDVNFKQVSDTVYCYKFISERNELKSFMIQVMNCGVVAVVDICMGV